MFLLLEREISSPSIFFILCLPPLTLPSLNPGSLFLCLFSRLKEAQPDVMKRYVSCLLT